MWLPRNERRTLSFYYQKTDDGSRDYSYGEPTDLINYLSNETRSAKGHQITSQTIKPINKHLRNSGLIKTQNIGPRETTIGLKPQGLQLGRKFNSKIGTIGVLCTEYMWLFVVLGAIIGANTLAVTIFKN